MAVSQSGVTLFPGVENVDDMFISTLDEMDKEVYEEIDLHDPIYRYFKDMNKIEFRSDIGMYKPVNLLDKPNSTVKDFSHYDDVDNTPQDALSQAKFNYGQFVGTQMYSREELVKNSGEEQLLDLVETKQEQLMTSMTNHFSERIKGDQDSDGRKAMGLGRIFAYDQSCGGITPTSPGYSYWNPQRGLKPAGTQYSLASEYRDGFRRLARLCSYQNEVPDLVQAGEDVYDQMQAYAESKLQMRIEDLKKERNWSMYEMFPMNNQVIIYDQDLDAKTARFINTNRVKIRIHSGTNFQLGPWQMMEGKVAKKRDMVTYYTVYCTRRNANGYIVYT